MKLSNSTKEKPVMKSTSHSEIVDMHHRIQRAAPILPMRTPINRSAPWCALLLTALACFAVSPISQAVSPAPDGGYPNFTTAEGQNALLHLTSGSANTGVGWFSLESVVNGSFNTGIGAGTLALNTGDENTASGAGALLLNTAGRDNTANGAFALFTNTVADGNTAVGANALFSNTLGVQNTAFGLNALASNTTAGANSSGANTGIGAFALWSNIIGGANTAIGYAALGNSTGGNNIAIGDVAGFDLTTGSDNIDIGNRGIAGESGTIRIGRPGTQTATFIAGISGATASGGVAVFVNTDGQLGTLTSSARFKDDIKPMDEVSEAILALKPVTFRYKKEIDPQGIPQFGLVAEEVARVNPDLVARDKKGEIYTVRYEQINVMLLNEFVKEHKKVETQEATIAGLTSTVAQQQKSFESKVAEQDKQIEALKSGLQKVSARSEVSSPWLASQMVLNER
jgi:hypothetical protein